MWNRPLVKKMLRDLRARWIALPGLVAILALGVGLFVGMGAVYRDLDGARARYYEQYRLADFSIDLKRAPASVIDEIREIPNIRALRGRVSMSVLVEVPDRSDPITGHILSIPATRSSIVNDLRLTQGAWFSGENRKEVILDDAFARANNIQPGARIKVSLLDEQHDLLVVGAAMAPEFVYVLPPGGGFAPDPARYGALYAPTAFLQEACDLDGAFNQIVGQALQTSPADLEIVLDRLEARLEPYGVTTKTPGHERPSTRFIADELQGIRISLVIVPEMFLAVVALALHILVGRIVMQQRGVIGTLKALGYSNAAVTRHFLGFGLFIGGLGGLSGLAAGYGLQNLYIMMYRTFFAIPDINPHFYLDIYLGAVLISVGFASLGIIGAVRRAARLNPAAAMRPPPPEQGRSIFMESIPFVWSRLSFRSKMILRSIFRNPIRSGASVLAAMLSTSIVVLALCNQDALDYMMEYQFEKIMRQDLSIALRDPVGRSLVTEVTRLPTIRVGEPELGVPCEMINGPYEKRTALIGLPAANWLQTPLDDQDTPIRPPESGLILTQKLAEILHVCAGESLTLRPLIAERRKVQAPIVAVVDSYMGLSAYGRIDYISRLLGEEWVANTVHALAETGDAPLSNELLREIKRRPGIIGISERERAFRLLEDNFGDTMKASMGALIFFAGMLAFGSILNTALVSLSERERDIGSLRVVGYSPFQVTQIVAGESILVNSVGIVAGLGLGILFQYLLVTAYNTEMYRFPFVIYPDRLAQSAAWMIGFVLLAQGVVYRLVRSLDWLEALKIKE